VPQRHGKMNSNLENVGGRQGHGESDKRGVFLYGTVETGLWGGKGRGK